MIRVSVTLLAIALAAACSKQNGKEPITTATAPQSAAGSDVSSQQPAMNTAQPSDSTAYSSATTTYSDPQAGAAPPAGGAPTSSADEQGQSAVADATPRLKPPQPGTLRNGQPNQADQTASSDARQQDSQLTALEVETIRSALIREYPNRADTIRALTITADGGIVTLRGLVLDESARPGIVAVVERTPGVKQVRDELRTRTQ